MKLYMSAQTKLATSWTTVNKYFVKPSTSAKSCIMDNLSASVGVVAIIDMFAKIALHYF